MLIDVLRYVNYLSGNICFFHKFALSRYSAYKVALDNKEKFIFYFQQYETRNSTINQTCATWVYLSQTTVRQVLPLDILT